MAEAVVGRMAAEAAVVGRTEAVAADTRAAGLAADRTQLPVQVHPAQAGTGGIRSMEVARVLLRRRRGRAERILPSIR